MALGRIFQRQQGKRGNVLYWLFLIGQPSMSLAYATPITDMSLLVETLELWHLHNQA